MAPFFLGENPVNSARRNGGGIFASWVKSFEKNTPLYSRRGTTYINLVLRKLVLKRDYVGNKNM